MTVALATAVGVADLGGTAYHFCSLHCLDEFRADPVLHGLAELRHGRAVLQLGNRRLSSGSDYNGGGSAFGTRSRPISCRTAARTR
jgi:YHS domain-containing protein